MKNNIHDLIGSIKFPNESEHFFASSCKLEQIQGEMYLCIDKDKTLRSFDYDTINTKSGINILSEYNPIALIDLYESIKKKLYKTSVIIELISIVEYTATIDWRNLHTNINIPKLLKWCKRYKTLPYSSQNSPYISESAEAIGINFQAFCEEIVSLASVYHLWLLIIGVDSRIIKTKLIKNAPSEIENIFWHVAHCTKNVDGIYEIKNISDCYYHIRFVFDCILQPKSQYSLDINENGFQINNIASGVMDLFALNIFSLMTKRDIFNEDTSVDVDGRIATHNIRTCKYPDCGKEFWPIGKEQYCIDHNRKTASYKKNKEKWKANKQKDIQNT